MLRKANNKTAEAKSTLSAEQKAIFDTMMALYEPIGEQSDAYKEAASKFNATLTENQKILTRAI